LCPPATWRCSVPSEIVSLEVNGIAWRGWEEVTITRAVDAVSGQFDVELTDRWSDDLGTLPIAASMPVTIATRAEAGSPGSDTDTTLIRGYIDTVKTSIAAGQHTISITGRDASADLVDCSAVHKPGEWRHKTCLQLAQILADPFGVPVTLQGDQGAAIPLHKIEPGETAWECLERALRQRELVAMPDANGGILIVSIGTGRTTTGLVFGQNLLSASADFNVKGRYSEYRVLAQNKGSDSEHGAAAAHILAVSFDDTIERYRPKVVTGESPKDTATAKRRADWEASVQAGRSATFEASVQGWRQADGTLWPLNAMCAVVCTPLRVIQDLMVGKVVHKLGSGGTTTALTLRSPLAYAQEFEKKLKKEKTGDGGDALKGTIELSKAEQQKILSGGK